MTTAPLAEEEGALFEQPPTNANATASATHTAGKPTARDDIASKRSYAPSAMPRPVLVSRAVSSRAAIAIPFALLFAACGSPPALTAPTASAPAGVAPSAPVHVRIVAFNDFHGNIAPPSGANGIIVARADDPVAREPGAKASADGHLAYVPAGGSVYLATLVKKLRAESPNSIVVSAGDLTGASPLVSNLFGDEPTIRVMNALGLDIEAVGNHDFDRGVDPLMAFKARAKFEYLAANVRRDGAAETLFPPYVVKDLGGVKVAFIGETLEATPSIVTTSSVKGLAFANEAATVNALVPELKKQGAAAIVLLLHQGGMQAPGGTYDSCEGFSGDLLPVLAALSKDVDVVVSAHTHQAYDCTIDGRLVTSAASYGRLATAIDLTIDPRTGRVVDKHAKNVVVTRDLAPDAEVAKIVTEYEGRARPQTSRVVGWIANDMTGDVKAAHVASCETPLGDLLADVQRDATKADIAFMNPGGVRADLIARAPGKEDHAVTYAEAFETQPFGNRVVTLTVSGADIRAILARQFGQRTEPRILEPSGLTYRYAYDRATRRATIDSILVNGAPLDDARNYRVAVNAFLANGGDGFGSLKSAHDRVDGANDLDVLVEWLGKHSSQAAPVEAPRTDRIVGDGCR